VQATGISGVPTAEKFREFLAKNPALYRELGLAGAEAALTAGGVRGGYNLAPSSNLPGRVATATEVNDFINRANQATGPGGAKCVVLVEGEVTDPALLQTLGNMKAQAKRDYGTVPPAFVGEDSATRGLYVVIMNRNQTPFASLFEERMHINQWRAGVYNSTTTLHTTAGQIALSAGQTRELDAAIRLLTAHGAGHPDITAAVIAETIRNLASHLGVQDVNSVRNIVEQLRQVRWSISNPVAAVP
jgi:hypothetical protein